MFLLSPLSFTTSEYPRHPRLTSLHFTFLIFMVIGFTTLLIVGDHFAFLFDRNLQLNFLFNLWNVYTTR